MAGKTLGTALIILGLLLILTPRYIFPVCGQGWHKSPAPMSWAKHGCDRTLTAESLLGIFTLAAALIPFFSASKKTLKTVSLLTIVIGALVILFPAGITGLCKVLTMPCRVGTFPALVILGMLFGVTGGLGLLLARKEK